MKRVFITALIACFASISVNAQDTTTENNNEFTRLQLRLRALAVVPNESATIEVIGGDVDISNAYIPELDITYFFTENIAAELILGTSKHDVGAVATAVGNIDLGSVRLLPPTLTAQYHFNGDIIKPYVGAGVNYTLFYDVDSGPVIDAINYDNSIGFAVQLGFDFNITDRWFLNIDAKYLWLNTDVTINATPALGATVGAEVNINPFIAGFGVGYKLF